MGDVIQFAEAWADRSAMSNSDALPLERILHVDDDEDIRSVTKMTLELLGGFKVAQFASGREAIENAIASRPQLLLLDVMMPVMSGDEVWQHLINLPGFENTPAVFMTAKAEKHFADKLIAKGAVAVITKPFDSTKLCDELRYIWASIN